MEKVARIAEFVDEEGLSSIWFARPNAFAWLTGGCNVVDRETDAGVAAVGYDGDLRVLTDTIEADRIETEELPDLPDDTPVEEFPWYESSLPEALAERIDGPAAADIAIPSPEFERVDPIDLRQPLTGTDVKRYRDLGRDTAAAVESVCHDLAPDDTEAEAATALREALGTRGIESPVALVGGADRATRYRHYTPTDSELGDYALLSVTAQRGGLHASCTRTVAFDPPSWLAERHTIAARVETTALAATRKAAAGGGTAGDVFKAIQDAYATLGYEGEWELHHQGGAAGFAGREWIATPDHAAPVHAPMAYAWNPTVQGAKSEGTVLVGDGFEALTPAGEEWPTETVSVVGEVVESEIELERPAVLER